MNKKFVLKSAAVSLALALVSIPALRADDEDFDTDEQEDAVQTEDDEQEAAEDETGEQEAVSEDETGEEAAAPFPTGDLIPLLTEKDGAKWDQGGLQGDYGAMRDFADPLLWSKWQPGFPKAATAST